MIASTEPTVFVIQQPRPKADGWVPNLEPATKFGRIVFVFTPDDRAFTAQIPAREKALRALEEFNPERDFLLWANFGDPACLYLVIMLLVQLGYPKLRWLYWSRGRKEGKMSNDNGYYFPVELDVSAVALPV